MKDRFLLIKKINELTTDYLHLDDNLLNAGEFSRLLYEIEEATRSLCILGTSLSDDELINFLDSKQIKQ